MTKESLASTCWKNYDLTVLKVLISRIPENTIKIILNACTSRYIDCKVDMCFLYEILEVLCHLQRVVVSLEMLLVILQWAVRVCTAIGGVKKRKKSWESYESYTIRSEIGLNSNDMRTWR